MKNETQRREEDIVVGYRDKNPMGFPIYKPALLHSAVIGALIGGFFLGIISYLVASGILPIQDLGQFSASLDWVAGVTGAGVGIALGGLFGGLYGLSKMIKNHKNKQS